MSAGWLWVSLAFSADPEPVAGPDAIPQTVASPPRKSTRAEPRVVVGDLVQDVPLVDPGGAAVRLADRIHPGRPLVLIFGSFT